MNAHCSLVSERSPGSGNLQCIHQPACFPSSNRMTIFNKTMAWSFIKRSKMALHVTSSYLWYIVLQWRQTMVFIWMFSVLQLKIFVFIPSLCAHLAFIWGDTQWLCKDCVIFGRPGKLSNYWLRVDKWFHTPELWLKIGWLFFFLVAINPLQTCLLRHLWREDVWVELIVLYL